MRAKFSFVLPGLLSLMLVVALSASAQDDVPGPNALPANSNLFSQDPSITEDKPLLMESRSSMDSLSHKLVPMPGAKQKTSEAKKAQAEEDPLNFNFLQYIIQKFKASELMME